jgi:antitoxin Phd
MGQNIWQLQEAKSKFSELVDKTLSDGVQFVTRRGEKAVVLLSIDEYERLTQRAGRISEFLLTSPLIGSDLNIERDQSLPGKMDIVP